MPSKAVNALTAVLFLILVVGVLVQTGAFGSDLTPADYANTTVTLRDQNGTTLTTVDVRIADTRQKRRVGLSQTTSLEPGDGMLFVHENEEQHAYVMRDMSFPLDIVFVAANGTVTTIHHAETEPGKSGGQLSQYRGFGTYILEVPRGYTNATGLDAGDTVEIPGAVD
jgi:uncharacterized membrane protein (UPF0127 family)